MKIARGLMPRGAKAWAEVTESASGPRYHRLENPPSFEANRVLEEILFERLLAPVEPVMLICIGLNYFEHAAALGVEKPRQPVVVPKGINAVLGPDAPIEFAPLSPLRKG